MEENATGVGDYGGSCTCPDGTVYQVGDLGDSCGTMACYGGVSGLCNEAVGAWSKRKVTCYAGSGLNSTNSSFTPEHFPSEGSRVQAMTKQNTSFSSTTFAEIYGLHGSRAYRIYVLSINDIGITATDGKSTAFEKIAKYTLSFFSS